ncbi:MAG: hydroxysqualene dehydroxylase HpnE [Stellaceae bacterium]
MSGFSEIHVVGAGLAGLAASLRLAEAGLTVALHEAAPQAGGRCRSYFDAGLGCRIDNGNHLLVAGNRAAMDYLAMIGAADSLVGPSEPRYDFLDLATGERWQFRPNRGRVPWWLLRRDRRISGTRLTDYRHALRLGRAGPDDRVGDLLTPDTTIYRRLWAPLATAALNTEPAAGSAMLLGRVLRETFGAGGAACRPLVPCEGLSESLIEPALATLRRKGVTVRFGARLRAVDAEGDRVSRLRFEEGDVALGPGQGIVLALPAAVAARLLPGITAPDQFRAILNAHFRIAIEATAPLFVGVIGGTAEWVFRKREVLSVTISAADRFMDQPAEELAPLLWADVCRAYGLGGAAMPAWQIVKERRATFAATPEQQKRRPKAATRWRNLALAGDWVDTGLPATVEGALRSGFAAAEILGGKKP